MGLQKLVEVEGIGEVILVKGRGARSIRVSVGADNKIRVSMPAWVPYQAGIKFVASRREWIAQHRRPFKIFKENDLIGKSHRLHFEASHKAKTVKTRVGLTKIKVMHSIADNFSSSLVQAAVRRAGLRAIKQEGENLLPQRLRALAKQNDYEFRSVDFKQMKARWGSCSHQKDITLNIFLMLLPWHLIDYVLIHELVHTKVLHHGPDFWAEFESKMPDAKHRRKELKTFSPYF